MLRAKGEEIWQKVSVLIIFSSDCDYKVLTRQLQMFSSLNCEVWGLTSSQSHNQVKAEYPDMTHGF